MNLTSFHEVEGLNTGLTQWVKDLALLWAVALLWLWLWPEEVASIPPQAWNLHVPQVALKKKHQKKKKKKTHKNKQKNKQKKNPNKKNPPQSLGMGSVS